MKREDKPCTLMGCDKYGQTGHHHHFLHGHENTVACNCRGFTTTVRSQS